MEKKKFQSVSIAALIVSILPLVALAPSLLHLSLSDMGSSVFFPGTHVDDPDSRIAVYILIQLSWRDQRYIHKKTPFFLSYALLRPAAHPQPAFMYQSVPVANPGTDHCVYCLFLSL